MILDSHQHFWKFHPEKHSWINDEMSVLKRDFLPADLEKVYQSNGVSSCIAVQADQSEDETNFLIDLSKEYHFIKGIVGWVDLQDDKLEEWLQYYGQNKKICGFRHIVQSEPDPNFMLRPDFQRGLALLEKYNFTYDILIFPTQMEAALQTVKNHPNLKFVIDHIAKPYIKKGEINGWEQSMKALASHKNVWCKVSGMVTETSWDSWKESDFTPYLDVVFDAFGIDRLMFGSDWPVCLLAGNYASIKEIAANYIKDFSEQDQQKFWSQNAAQFYNIKVN